MTDYADKLIAQVAESHPDVVDLAQLASLAVRVEPGLLRRIRWELRPELGPGAEADLWFSPLVAARNSQGFVLDDGVRAVLAERLRATRRFSPALRILEEWRQPRSPELMLQERLAVAQLDRDSATERSRELVAAIAHALEDPERGDLADWAAYVVGRLPDDVRLSPEGRVTVSLAHARRANTDDTRTEIGVRVVGNSLELTDPGESGATRLSVPGLDPLPMLVSTGDEGRRAGWQLIVKSAGPARLEGGFDPGTAGTLVAPDGTRHRFAVASQSFEEAAVATGEAPIWKRAQVDRFPPDSELVLEPCDIFLTRGRSFVSSAARFFTRRFGEKRSTVNHVGVIVEEGSLHSAIAIESLSRVRRHAMRRYADKRTTSVAVFRPINLTEEEKATIVAKAETYVGRKYGWRKILYHLLDWALNGAYVFRRLINDDDYPISSWVVAYAYLAAGKSFGVAPGAANPDDIWDFVVMNPDKYVQVRALAPIPALDEAEFVPKEDAVPIGVSQRFGDLLVDEFGIERAQISGTRRFIDDFEMDSLDVVEMVMAVEDTFDIQISDDEVAELPETLTVAEATAMIAERLSPPAS